MLTKNDLETLIEATQELIDNPAYSAITEYLEGRRNSYKDLIDGFFQ
jgi:hypothetical protein